MKNLLLILLLAGCHSGSESNTGQKYHVSYTYLNWGCVLVEIDGCEYIATGDSYNSGITHKGNCKNPIHKHSPTP